MVNKKNNRNYLFFLGMLQTAMPESLRAYTWLQPSPPLILAQAQPTVPNAPVSSASPQILPSPPPPEGVQGVVSSSLGSGEVQEVKRMVQEGLGAFPKKVLVLEELGEKGLPVLFDIDFDQSANSAYFDWSNSKQLAWDLKLNYRQAQKSNGTEIASLLSDADIIIHASKTGSWTIYRKGKKNALEKLLDKAPPQQSDGRSLATWLFDALGWDGVVIGQTGDTLIVGSTSEILKQEGLQALSVNFSHGKWILPETERKGSGILSLAKYQGPFGYFDIVFVGSGVKSIPTGTKLIIEKKK